ncbi:hypothetical protein FACS189459_0280 [Bacilli bacterium]|nr:hypothetical protein FACS189459_0280 [Bacilli bacterium]
MILQLNRKLDVDTITNVTDKDALNDLKSKLGDGVVNDLIVQCALDSSTQTQMVETIIKSVFGGKITVYDRRLNDQLGKLWVENFKNKN